MREALPSELKDLEFALNEGLGYFYQDGGLGVKALIGQLAIAESN